MRLNSKLPLSDNFQARIAAQSILSCGFDMRRAVAELRPDIKGWRAFGAKLMDEPAVRHEIEVIMSRTERDASKFVKLMWDWLEAPPAESPLDKSATEKRLTAARILAKGYINEKRPDVPARPLAVDGMSEGLDNLTGNVTAHGKAIQ